MRRRLVQLAVLVAIVAVALLGVPLAVGGVLSLQVAEEQRVQRFASLLGELADTRLEDGIPITQGIFSVLPDDMYGILHVDTAEGRVSLSEGTAPADPINASQRSTTTTAVVQSSQSALRIAQLRLVALVLVASLVAVLAALGLGLLLARRLAEPLDDLAGRARRLGAGGRRQTFPRYGLPEIDEVADALERGASRVAAMLATERQFAQDASHQLRTPLTALSMRLEEILHNDDVEEVREEARIALGQVERLSGVVDHLLANARQSRSATAVPLAVDEVIRQQVEEWEPAFAKARRRVQRQGPRGLTAVASPAGLPQVLATLIENSLAHGAGTVTIRTRFTGSSVVIEVADEGPGVPPELGARVFERSVSGRSSTGLGLSLARDLAEADGGRLELVSLKPACFAVFLASVEPDDEDTDDTFGGARGGGVSTGSRAG